MHLPDLPKAGRLHGRKLPVNHRKASSIGENRMTNSKAVVSIFALLLLMTFAAAQAGVYDLAETNSATEAQPSAKAPMPVATRDEAATASNPNRSLQGLNLSVGGVGATPGGQAIVSV